ncbi:MAG: S8 family serine peptidase [Acidobacteria bacterium]|nr:S8 family serine peptidase [Acidobacteriota bacterium]
MRFWKGICAVGVLAAAGVAAAGDVSDQWQAKVDPWVMSKAGTGAGTEFIVFLADQADLSGASGLETKAEKGRFVVDALRRTAAKTQKPILAQLKALGVEHRGYWISNMIWVRGDLDIVRHMAENKDVFHIYANPSVRIDERLQGPHGEKSKAPDAIEWNISLVGAPDVWALGIDGEGAVVAGQDTGYMWDHPALVEQYRGGPAGDHAYNWHDAIHSGGGSCGSDSPEPCDDHGHGTHTMGTIVGDDGIGNQVGMAPGAQWIGCRNMDQGAGTPTTYAECYQFFIAPTDLDDLNPDPAKAPDVINNSWGCPPSEGCTDPNVLLSVVQAVRAAGIVTVHSAGNSGSSCSTVSDPAATYRESFSVGATDSSDDIANFSSRGPVTIDGSNRLKPDISAPGVNIRSSTRDGGYQGGWDGTSMAGPHVAGLVALLVSASPGLAGDVDTIEEVIEQTAVPLTSSQGCGGSGPTEVPNNVFGWGRIDALTAFNYSLDFRVVVEPESVAVCAPADAVFDITIEQFQGFSEPVTLTTNGLPAGASGSFTVNPVTPPGTSELTISGTAAVAPGAHGFDVFGASSPSGIVQQAPAVIEVYDTIPTAAVLVSPANGEIDIALLPTLDWNPVAQAATYRVEVATDAGFASLVASAVVEGSSHTLEAPLDPTTVYYWRVGGGNPCGDGVWSAVFSFTTRAIPPILLVDDDDNSPDVQPTYTAGLDALGLQYDVWDTANSDVEPSAAELAPYRVVIWFTGDEFGGAAGPGAAAEAGLASWLANNSACLLLSAQDYYYDRGLTAFMQSHLGLAAATSDTGQTTVTGAGSAFGGHGPFSLSYPFTNYSDTMTVVAGGETAFTGNQGDAAVSMQTGFSYATFWGFPWEALPTAADREATLQAFLDSCLDAASGLFRDNFESGDTTAWSSVTP